MSHSTPLRRTSSSVGAAAILGMFLAAPAFASQDPGSVTSTGTSSSASQSQFPNGLDRTRREGGLDRQRQVGGFTLPGENRLAPEPATKPAPAPVVVYMEDHAVEYLQVGAGLVAGAAIAGAGAVVISRRGSGGLEPA